MGAFILFLGLIIIFLGTINLYQVEVIRVLKKQKRGQSKRGDKHFESFLNKVNENNKLIEKREQLLHTIVDLLKKQAVMENQLEMYRQFEELYHKDLQ